MTNDEALTGTLYGLSCLVNDAVYFQLSPRLGKVASWIQALQQELELHQFKPR